MIGLVNMDFYGLFGWSVVFTSAKKEYFNGGPMQNLWADLGFSIARAKNLSICLIPCNSENVFFCFLLYWRTIEAMLNSIATEE